VTVQVTDNWQQAGQPRLAQEMLFFDDFRNNLGRHV
jgi:hypothetical protein